ncbi:MAG: YgiT-type zinc finger protein [Deferrisomatales bacterium]
MAFDAVPAWVCGQCGEVLPEEAQVDAIQDALASVDAATERRLAAG